MEQEIWKDIPGYEGLYQASNLGNIKGVDRISITNTDRRFYKKYLKGKILKFMYNMNGYVCVCLCKDSIPKRYLVHRLVGLTFLGFSDLDINHKDGNKRNNHINNLEWCTKSYNIQHSFDILKRKSHLKGKKGFLSPRAKCIKQYDLQGNFMREWSTIKEASEFYNISHTCISSCCAKRQKTSGGFIWEYETH